MDGTGKLDKTEKSARTGKLGETEQSAKMEGDSGVQKIVPAPAPGEPLENPLPLPKAAARRGSEYAFEPGPEQMCFDVEPAEGDDYDI